MNRLFQTAAGFLAAALMLIVFPSGTRAAALTPEQAEDGFVERGNWIYYDITTSSQLLKIEVYNLSDDVDMYIGINFQPTKTAYSCRPYNGGRNSELCTFTNYGSNAYYVGVFGYNTSTFTIKATVGGGTGCALPNGDWGYCSNPDCAPCNEGEGDCDSDGECAAGLVCAQDRGDTYGFVASLDICEPGETGPGDDVCVRNNGDWSYCSDPNCGPCAAGEGDCDTDDECQDELVCVQDVGARYGFSMIMDICEDLSGGGGGTTGCGLNLGHWQYCTDPNCGPCAAGEGDCDSDAECQDGLACMNNVGANYGFVASLDVCEVSGTAGLCSRFRGDWGYCSDPNCSPCPAGEGDCDSDAECEAGLLCQPDKGATFGWPSSLDVCLAPDGGGVNGLCTLSPGTWGYCADPECGPCAEGQGDCDGDDECQVDLVCVQGAGSAYGFPSSMDICEALGAGGTCTLHNGSWGYCSDSGCAPCEEGEGDCDSDGECQAGLYCAQGAGAAYGFPSSMDICERASASGGQTECTERLGDWSYCGAPGCGPCDAGEGDCNSDAECKPGLVCSQDVGARYGWVPSMDVCEYSGN